MIHTKNFKINILNGIFFISLLFIFVSDINAFQKINNNITEEYNSEYTPSLNNFSNIYKHILIDDDHFKVSIEPYFEQALKFCNAAQNFWQKGELENAIQSLDHAYSIIINIDIANVPKFLQKKKNLRFMISKRILEIYASRNNIVKGDHKEIPIQINKQVKYEINKFTTIEKSFFIQSLKRSGLYRPMILKALEKAGLPLELSWLPLVESGFKLRAHSKAGALGLWQFIASTGYMFGLKRNQFIDERLDPEKSTVAAIEFLKRMHGVFGDWSTVLAAYNCGQGRVLRIIRTQNINYLDNFWDLFERLPRETARYFPRFIATLHIINNLKKYGLDSIKVSDPIEFKKVTIEKQVHLKDIAHKLEIPEKTLTNLNPELRYKILPETKYSLRIPSDKNDLLLATINDIKIVKLPQRLFKYHRVRFGESLSSIANKYRSSIKSIIRANNISKRNFIKTGKILKIPLKKFYGKHIYNNDEIQNDTIHKVENGDSLWNIAKRYHTTTKKMKELNNLSSSSLNIGEILKIPVKKNLNIKNDTNKKTSKKQIIYQVKPGDSPSTIAAKHNMDVKKLLSINNLNSKSKIYPGQKLYIE